MTENQISCSSAEVYLVENENSKKVLLAMVVRLKDEKIMFLMGSTAPTNTQQNIEGSGCQFWHISWQKLKGGKF